MNGLRVRDRQPRTKNHSVRAFVLAVAAVAIAGATTAAPQLGGAKPETYALEMTRVAAWPATDNSVYDKPGGAPWVTTFEREVLVPGIAHYRFDLRVGDGPYDMLRIHRVVKEGRRQVPARTRESIFLLHGDGFGFLKFIFGSTSAHLAPEASVAVYLASAGWDVWGIDQPWIHVPAEETDFAFAAGWGMQHQVDCLERGISVARLVRLFTGNGWHPMKLLGYSSGGFPVYALMNAETQRPESARSVDGFVIADVMFKYDTADPLLETVRQFDCAQGEYHRGMMDSGNYMADLTLLSTVGALAYSAPADPSPYFEGLTNLQVALVLGTSPDPTAGIPWYHFVAPFLEEGNDVPTGLRFTNEGAWVDFMRNFVPYEPTAFFADYFEVTCDELDVPWDDHFGAIVAPALLLSPAGGIGRAGHFSISQLGSPDRTIAEFSFFPPAEVDFAHIDLWLADNSPTMVWPTLLEWLDAHSANAGVIATRQGAAPDEAVRVGPNPGAPPFTFAFDMRLPGNVEVQVFDVSGRRVAAVFSGPAAAGAHRVVWDGRNATGHEIAQGVYFARVQTPHGVTTSRFVNLLR